MSDVNTRLTPNAYDELVSTVERITTGSLGEKPEVASWLSLLLLSAEGAAGSNDSLGSATAGP